MLGGPKWDGETTQGLIKGEQLPPHGLRDQVKGPLLPKSRNQPRVGPGREDQGGGDF